MGRTTIGRTIFFKKYHPKQGDSWKFEQFRVEFKIAMLPLLLAVKWCSRFSWCSLAWTVPNCLEHIRQDVEVSMATNLVSLLGVTFQQLSGWPVNAFSWSVCWKASCSVREDLDIQHQQLGLGGGMNSEKKLSQKWEKKLGGEFLVIKKGTSWRPIVSWG